MPSHQITALSTLPYSPNATKSRTYWARKIPIIAISTSLTAGGGAPGPRVYATDDDEPLTGGIVPCRCPNAAAPDGRQPGPRPGRRRPRIHAAGAAGR